MSRGLIFDIQRYAVHDGPGIRSLVFLKGCPLRCAWCSNPESHEPRPELMRRRAWCRACGSCRKACAKVAGQDRSACSRCQDFACVQACPHDALAVAGRELEALEVLDQVERDRDFYRNSGGGVTFSGGEPFFQPGFLAELLAGCRARGLHAAVETCGCAAADLFRELEPKVDLFLFDLKVLDPAAHRKHTGQDNEVILENFRLLASRVPDKLQPRLTVVPGISDTEDNLAALAALLKECGLSGLELLPYHPLGQGKWAALDRSAPYQAENEASAASAAACLSGRGLACAFPAD